MFSFICTNNGATTAVINSNERETDRIIWLFHSIKGFNFKNGGIALNGGAGSNYPKGVNLGLGLGLSTKSVRFQWGWNEYLENQIRHMVTTWPKRGRGRETERQNFGYHKKNQAETNTVTSSIIVYFLELKYKLFCLVWGVWYLFESLLTLTILTKL